MLLMLSTSSTVGSAGSTGAAGATEVGRGANLDGAATRLAIDAAASSERPSDGLGKEGKRRLRRWDREDPPGQS